MKTSTGPHIRCGRWARILGTGATALVAAGAMASSAGAAAPANAPGGATGSVAAVSGSTIEVQSQSSGQTAVNWTTTTQFSKTVTESVNAIAAGDCVTATGTASKKSKTTIAARSITVSMPNSSGACTGATGARTGGANGAGTGGGGFFRGGGGGGGAPGGASGTRPSFPGGAGGSSNFRKQFASLAVASGKVTAVKGSTITVSGITVTPGTSKASSKTKKPAKPKTQTLKITTTSSTPATSTQTAAAADLAVGDCVSAFGPAATNGSVSATTIRITSTGGGTCTGGFPGGGGFFGGAPGGGSA